MEMVFYCPTCNRETDNCSCEKDQLRARVAELEAQLAERDAEISSIRAEMEKQRANAFGAQQARNKATIELNEAQKMLLLAKEALASASTFGGFVNAVAQKAIAAINDSKAVEGLILCDAVPRAWQRKWFADGEEPKKERNANGRLVLPSRFKFRPLTEIVVFKDDVPLYAPRRPN